MRIAQFSKACVIRHGYDVESGQNTLPTRDYADAYIMKKSAQRDANTARWL